MVIIFGRYLDFSFNLLINLGMVVVGGHWRGCFCLFFGVFLFVGLELFIFV